MSQINFNYSGTGSVPQFYLETNPSKVYSGVFDSDKRGYVRIDDGVPPHAMYVVWAHNIVRFGYYLKTSPGVPVSGIHEGTELEGFPESLDYTEVPVPISLLPIHINGRYFFTADNNIWQWKMCDGYSDLAVLRDRGESALFELWDERDLFSFNGYRVYSAVNSFAILHPLSEPNLYDLARHLTELAHSRGVRIEWTGGDYQVVLPTYDNQLNHHNLMLDMIRSLGSLDFYDWCNEAFNNGGKREAIDNANKSGVLCTYGHPFLPVNPDGSTPHLDYHAFGGNRHYPDTYVSMSKMWWYGAGIDVNGTVFDVPRPIVAHEPVGFAEVYIQDRRSNDPYLAEVLARSARAYGNGATFHSDAGINGQLFGPITRQCASSFRDGCAY